MKKMKLLLGILPIMFLTSCTGGTTPSEDEINFSIQETIVTVTDKTASIHLDWTPSGDVIEFSNFTFTLANETSLTTSVIPGEEGSRPLELTITFSNVLTSDDKGNLKFHYNDKTSKKEGDAEVNGIDVKKPSISEKRTLSFSGTNCYLKDSGGQIITSDVTVDKGTIVTYFIEPEDGYLKPKDNQIDFTYTDDPLTPFTDDHFYNPTTGEVLVKLNENVTIYASGEPDVPAGTFDEIELPKLGYKKEVTLNARDGKICIKVTNATEALSSDDWLNITCKLDGESRLPDSQVFSDVDIIIDGEEVTPTFDTALVGPLQYWYVDMESNKPSQDNLYIILTLNEGFTSELGRVIKPNYTGEVGCVLWNQETWNKQEQIEIDYRSITEKPSL